MDKPFFSVIIPALNEAAYLPRLLESLVIQRAASFEVIVVDGRSSDATVAKAREFTKRLSSLRIISSPKRNLSFQRNLGAQKADGTYLVFVDADAQLPVDYLEKINRFITQNQAVFVTTWLAPDSPMLLDRLSVTVANITLEALKLIGKQMACGANFIVKKDIFAHSRGFREDTAMSEDHDLSVRLGKMGYTLHVLKQPRFVYCLRRIRSQGYATLAWQYFVATVYFVFKGPMTKKIYDYNMGGHVHEK